MGILILILLIVSVIGFAFWMDQQDSSPPARPVTNSNSKPKFNRQQRDLEEMRRYAPKAEPQHYEDGGIVWTEWTRQEGRSYHLAYWHDGSDYQAAVLEGDNPQDRGNAAGCHLFDDRRICLKGSNEPPYIRIIDARARAIVWALGYSEYLRTGEFPLNHIR
jgi:hypothetical protein